MRAGDTKAQPVPRQFGNSTETGHAEPTGGAGGPAPGPRRDGAPGEAPAGSQPVYEPVGTGLGPAPPRPARHGPAGGAGARSAPHRPPPVAANLRRLLADPAALERGLTSPPAPAHTSGRGEE